MVGLGNGRMNHHRAVVSTLIVFLQQTDRNANKEVSQGLEHASRGTCGRIVAIRHVDLRNEFYVLIRPLHKELFAADITASRSEHSAEIWGECVNAAYQERSLRRRCI